MNIYLVLVVLTDRACRGHSAAMTLRLSGSGAIKSRGTDDCAMAVVVNRHTHKFSAFKLISRGKKNYYCTICLCCCKMSDHFMGAPIPLERRNRSSPPSLERHRSAKRMTFLYLSVC